MKSKHIVIYCLMLVVSREFIFYLPVSWNNFSERQKIDFVDSMIKEVCAHYCATGECYKYPEDCRVIDITKEGNRSKVEFICQTSIVKGSEI